jgi:hypothetical protein
MLNKQYMADLFPASVRLPTEVAFSTTTKRYLVTSCNLEMSRCLSLVCGAHMDKGGWDIPAISRKQKDHL